MTSLLAGKALVVALNEGLLSHSEALVCDDLRGPLSLFGEGRAMPRPIRELLSHCRGGNGTCCIATENRVHIGPYARCSVLWESEESVSPEEAVKRIINHGRAPSVYGSDLSVPAPTFLAGRSTSSFALAWQLAADGHFPDWSAVLCSCQTEGRGQLRRAWHSPRGNLHVTFRLPADPVLRGDAASLVAGCLLARAFRFLGFPVYLKWPNDLLLGQDHKVGGILLEEKDGIVMAGLGVNIAEMPDEGELRKDHALPAAVLLPHHAERENHAALAWRMPPAQHDDDVPLAPFSLWKRLVTGVILEYSQRVARLGLPYVLHCLNGDVRSVDVPESAGPCSLPGNAQHESQEGPVDLPSALLAWKGRRVALSDQSGAVGSLLGVGPGGGLLLNLDNGGHREFFSGSLSRAL